MKELVMIKSFADKDTKAIWEKRFVKKFSAIAQLARDKLVMLNHAYQWSDLSFSVGNNLHKLRHDRRGQWAITITGPYRICFTPRDGYYWEIEIVDYH